MQPDRLTIKAQEALQNAQQLAQERSHQQLDAEHLALALIQQEDSLIPQLLQRIGAPAAPTLPRAPAPAPAPAAGGALPTISPHAEQKLLNSKLTSANAPTGSYWFGIRETTERVYQHITGEALGFTIRHVFLWVDRDSNPGPTD